MVNPSICAGLQNVRVNVACFPSYINTLSASMSLPKSRANPWCNSSAALAITSGFVPHVPLGPGIQMPTSYVSISQGVGPVDGVMTEATPVGTRFRCLTNETSIVEWLAPESICLLYTSDAADDLL